jgi:hypothetical protein
VTPFRDYVGDRTGAGDGRGEATHRAGEHTRKERKMLSATLGMLAMLPVVFGVAAHAMVSR